MKINFNSFNYNIANSPYQKRYLNLKPLSFDTVSFSSLKKSQFSGIDLMIINKYKAPIEKFKTKEDFYNWCRKKIEEIKSENYKGRHEEATIQRKIMLHEWFKYILEDNPAYTDSTNLMIADGITKGLTKNSDSIPPFLHKSILAETIEEIARILKYHPKEIINFNKKYQTNLQKQYIEEISKINPNKSTENMTGWIIIPSKEKDPEHFKENIQKLKTMSLSSWCTKNFSADTYLSLGDFHIYLENGKTKIGMRFEDNTVCEVQGEKNSTRIPIKYLDIVNEHIKKNNYHQSIDMVYEIATAQEAREEIENAKSILEAQGMDFNSCSTKQLFDILNYKYEEDKNGKLILKEYRAPSQNYGFEDLGVNEDKLFKDIVLIEGDADFYGTSVTNLGSLECIGGNVSFTDSKITDLGNLKAIGGNADFNFAKISTLSNVEYIGGSAHFQYSNIEDLGNLKTIGKDAVFWNSIIKDTGNLETVGGDADFLNSNIKTLKNLRYIGKNAIFKHSNVESLGNLEWVKGDIIIEPKKAEALGIEKLKVICPNFMA